MGEKLAMFARTGERHPEFLEALPEFSARVRNLFTATEIKDFFTRAEADSLVDPDFLGDATEEELEDLRDTLQDAHHDRQHRAWLRTMLIGTGA